MAVFTLCDRSNSMVQTSERVLSLDEFLAQPETKPASELINGQIVQKPMPQGQHSYLQLELAALINGALRQPKIARAGTELRCTFGDRSIVPDIAVFTWEHIPREPDGRVSNVFNHAPNWTIEILSPGQSSLRPTKNILHCLAYGGEMGWLIDPEDLTVLVYTPDRGTGCLDQPDDRLLVPEFARDLDLTIQDLLDCLLD